MLAIMTNEAANPQAPEAQVEQMYEYGYRKSNYGPDELVTDAHGNPISVVDAVLLLTAHPGQHRFGDPPVRGDRHDPASGGAVGLQPA